MATTGRSAVADPGGVRDGAVVLPPDALDVLIPVLRERGYRVLGPTVRDGAIVYDEIDDAGQLPTGWTDIQEPGRYRLERRADGALFGYAVGPHSWKGHLLPPRLRLLRARQADGGRVEISEEPTPEVPTALIGVRSCELRAIATQDRILAGRVGPDGRRAAVADRDYAARRAALFVVAVSCHEPGGTCFCASMGTGPAVQDGYDLALTELLTGSHRLLAEAGTDTGAAVLAEVAARRESRPTTAADHADADAANARACARMGRSVEADGLRDLLAATYEHPRYDDVTSRCLTCGNCTMVCPTCFCVTVEDTGDLAGGAERVRVWESCFSLDHSYVHPGPVRASPRARYRQWLTHKFGTWHDQFGESGCVGCGRCITWCPVGIDVTEELAALRGAPASPAAATGQEGSAP
jgi:ferredoxin